MARKAIIGGKSKDKQLSIARALYDVALDKYPDSAQLRALRGLFYFGYLGDSLMSRVEVQKAVRLDPTVDVRYLMFCLDVEYAQKRVSDAHGGQIDLITFPEFAKNLRTAKKLHRSAVRVIYAFWKTLLSDKPDLNIVPALIAKVQRIEDEADGVFVKLLTQGSRSQALLREFAMYLRNVKFQPDLARMYDSRADNLDAGTLDNDGRHDKSQARSVLSDARDSLEDEDFSENR